MFNNLPSVWLHELTWEEVATYLRTRDTILVPFGTTEQHGPAGPLGLDGYDADGPASGNYNNLIDPDAADPISGTVALRSYLCQVRRGEP